MAVEGEPDELDGLFARLEPASTPDDFVARVMARARSGEVARWAQWQRAAFAVLYLGALLGLAVLSYLTGNELTHSQTRDVIALALHDLSAVKDTPGLYFAALGDAIPWALVAAVVLDVAVLAAATHLLLKATGQAPSGRGRSSVGA
jgi:hypothetical protein